LLRDRPQWQRLTQHPELVPSAIEELLRYDTSVQFNQRVANEDVVYKGIPIAENDRIIVLLGAANRDPEVFENPETLDIARSPNPHLSFGAGMYHCLGVHLARMQMQIAVDAMVRHMPGLPTWMMRGLATMPAEL